jgi:hypothetical protein
MTAADASNPQIAVFSAILGICSDSERRQGLKRKQNATCSLRVDLVESLYSRRGTRKILLQTLN